MNRGRYDVDNRSVKDEQVQESVAMLGRGGKRGGERGREGERKGDGGREGGYINELYKPRSMVALSLSPSLGDNVFCNRSHWLLR